ncbi:MAG: hypothetical protein JETCAE03_33400 [Ignavibacteriaceae bacterium]|nr:MAG: hypothetical protein JETCAE03_33400 [Ignavibacteriaceae bacterium]
MYIKKKNGKIIKIKTPWDVMLEQQTTIVQKTITSGVGGDTPSSSGSAA